MAHNVTVVTSSGKKYYKIKDGDKKYYCQKLSSGFFGGWVDIGSARNFDRAIDIIKSHAGHVQKVYVD